MVSQAMIFFLAGFTAVSNTMSFLCYELATNPEIQQKLYDEILETEILIDNQPIGYEKLQRMKYLDCVISETLRKWCINILIDRKVSKQYVLDDQEGNKVVLQPGDCVWMPALGIHRDPKYYPEPMEFRPERFLPNAQPPVHPDTYMPFGAGPRACIASRFALMQLKATVFHVFKTFNIEICPNTLPLRLRPTIGTLESDDMVFSLKLRGKS